MLPITTQARAVKSRVRHDWDYQRLPQLYFMRIERAQKELRRFNQQKRGHLNYLANARLKAGS
jgi:hypothetical protein